MLIILYLLQDAIVAAFGATADAAALVSLFCTWLAATFIFNSSQFISNATLNNLGYPHYSTILNFTRATAGTIPFVYFGALWAGAPGVLIGQAAGSVIVGIASIALSLHMLRKCSGDDGPLPRTPGQTIQSENSVVAANQYPGIGRHRQAMVKIPDLIFEAANSTAN
jgi:hypothetical protein